MAKLSSFGTTIGEGYLPIGGRLTLLLVTINSSELRATVPFVVMLGGTPRIVEVAFFFSVLLADCGLSNASTGPSSFLELLFKGGLMLFGGILLLINFGS